MTELPPDENPVLDIGGSWEAYLTALPPGRRTSFAYAERRIARDAECRFVVHREPDAVAAAFPRFDALRTGMWPGRGRPLQLTPTLRSEEFSRRLNRAAVSLAEEKVVRLATLGTPDLVVAAALIFHCGDRWLYYMVGWDPEYSRYSPGTVLAWLSIREAAREGCRVFDFGRGDEPYKFRFGAQLQLLRNLRLVSQSP